MAAGENRLQVHLQQEVYWGRLSDLASPQSGMHQIIIKMEKKEPALFYIWSSILIVLMQHWLSRWLSKKMSLQFSVNINRPLTGILIKDIEDNYIQPPFALLNQSKNKSKKSVELYM